MHRAESCSLPTDRFFTSCCSPPHLSVTQLLSVTHLSASVREGLPPSCSIALEGALAEPLAAPTSMVDEFLSHCRRNGKPFRYSVNVSLRLTRLRRRGTAGRNAFSVLSRATKWECTPCA